MGIEVLLDIAADSAGDRIALGSREGGITFARWRELAQGAATVLRDSGAAHVGFVGVNGPAFSIAVFAAAIAGLPLTPLNYRLTDEQLAELVGELPTPLLLVDEAFFGRVSGERLLSTDELLEQAAKAEPVTDAFVDDDEAAVVLFTSGTTSKPKGVLLRHGHLTSYVLQTVELLAAEEHDCALVAVPPYHVAGVATVLSNAYAGRRVVHAPQFTPAGWLETVRSEAVTSAMVVPTMLARVVEHLDGAPAGAPSLASLAYGGARVSPAVLERALLAFPETGFVNAYGLTETSSTIAVLGPDDHRLAVASDDPAVRARLGSAGLPVPGIEVVVRDEDGRVLPAGEVGEVLVRGPQVSGEYVGHGSSLDADGWFPTRDRGWLDAEGYLFIEGRGDDTIIRGGENIAPAEVEDVLTRFPGVRDAAVVGLPDEEWGQVIAAVVVADEDLDLDALSGFAREQLRGAKTPARLERWSGLPYTPTGKLLRREVLAHLEARTQFHPPTDQES